jgi:hypothetical protein
MPRGVAHSPELRAQAVAAVLAGTSIAQAAAQFKLDKSLVSRWVAGGLQPVATEKNARARERDTDLIMGYFRAALRAMISQAEVFGDAGYCRTQDADKLAIAHGVLADKLVGVSATAQALGLIGHPVQPALESGTGPAARGPATDDR